MPATPHTIQDFVLHDASAQPLPLSRYAGQVVLVVNLGRMPAIPDIAWGWPLMVLVVAVLIMLSNWTLQYGASRLAATTAAVVMLSEVVFASASNVLIEGTVLSGRLLLGGALVLSASLIAAIESKLP